MRPTLIPAVAFLALAAWNGYAAPGRDLSAEEGSLKVGDPAPDFKLQDVDGKNPVALSNLRGQPVVLFFGSCT